MLDVEAWLQQEALGIVGVNLLYGAFFHHHEPALEEQRNGGWRYLEFLQVTSWITVGMFMRERPGGTRARPRSRPVDLPGYRY